MIQTIALRECVQENRALVGLKKWGLRISPGFSDMWVIGVLDTGRFDGIRGTRVWKTASKTVRNDSFLLFVIPFGGLFPHGLELVYRTNTTLQKYKYMTSEIRLWKTTDSNLGSPPRSLRSLAPGKASYLTEENFRLPMTVPSDEKWRSLNNSLQVAESCQQPHEWARTWTTSNQVMSVPGNSTVSSLRQDIQYLQLERGEVYSGSWL